MFITVKYLVKMKLFCEKGTMVRVGTTIFGPRIY